MAQDTSARLQVDATQRSVIQTLAQAWSQRAAAHLNILADKAEVRAAQATFDGIRVEYRAGLRQTLDVLIAQETLTSAEIALVDAEHDEYLDQAAVLSALGRLEVRVVLQGAALYRPEVSFTRNRNKGATPRENIPEMLDRIGAAGLSPRPIKGRSVMNTRLRTHKRD